jgi:aldose 1-epimerase
VSNTTLDDTLQLPGTDRIVAVDDILIPTGELSSTAEADHPLNYSSPRSIGDSLAAVGFCGKDSIGLDTCFVFDAPTAPEAPAPGIAQVVWTSPATGIRMQVHTNQPAVQLYNGLHFNGSQETQLGKVAKHGTLAIEPQGL